jgi:fumarylacetoacetate (FAA) hydrolase family protein
MKAVILQMIGIVALLFCTESTQAIDSPYGAVLSQLWAEGAQLEKQKDYAQAQKIYENALQESQKLPDSLIKRCAIAFSRVGLESMIAVQKEIKEHENHPEIEEIVEITLNQQFLSTWENVGRELKLRSSDCP